MDIRNHSSGRRRLEVRITEDGEIYNVDLPRDGPASSSATIPALKVICATSASRFDDRVATEP